VTPKPPGAIKDELLGGMVDVICGRIGLPEGPDWREAMRRRARAGVPALPLAGSLLRTARPAAVPAVLRRGRRADPGRFKLFLTARLGYQVGLLRGRLFLEPSVAFTYWPVDTHVPPAFAERDAWWPNHFLFEPGLHFGVRF
jgi:hypothetical protein